MSTIHFSESLFRTEDENQPKQKVSVPTSNSRRAVSFAVHEQKRDRVVSLSERLFEEPTIVPSSVQAVEKNLNRQSHALHTPDTMTTLSERLFDSPEEDSNNDTSIMSDIRADITSLTFVNANTEDEEEPYIDSDYEVEEFTAGTSHEEPAGQIEEFPEDVHDY